MTEDENKLRITVSDLALGKQALLPITSDFGIILDRYEWVRPSLEEIFLKISA